MIFVGVITFGPSSIQIVDPINGVQVPAGLRYRRLLIQQARGNKAACYVGLSNVSNDGSSIGVIKDLADAAGGSATASMAILDIFEDNGNVEPSLIYVHGALGDKVIVSLFT